ncbi:MAG: glycosyltransferase, partial [Alphaproteobacteria bacterium]
MRIAQAIALSAPEFQGGATLVCRRLARELAARGHVLDVVSGRTTASEPIGALRTDLVDGIRTWRVNLGGAFHGHSREGWENPAATSSVRRFLAERRPDVLHVHGLQALGAGVIRAAADAGVPVVWTMHDWWWLCPCLFRLAPGGGPCSPIPDPSRCFPGAEFPFEERRATLAAALEAVARVLVPTAYLRDSLVANGLDPARVSVQENGIEPPSPDFAALRSSHARDGVLRLGFVGGAGNREKGLGVLLDAASRVRADVEIRLHAVDPADAGPARGGARLEFLPPFAPEGLDAALADLDAVVVPSLMRESCSLVTREALVRGLPVVTSDCGGPEEVVRHGANGLVFDTGSAAGLAAAIERLAGEPGLLERLAASPRPELVTPGEQAGSAEALYREVVREATSGPRGIVGASPRPRTASAASGEPQRAGRAPVATRPREGQAPPGLRSVLFLVGVDGAPLRYRVRHLVERLALRGVHSEVLHHSDSDARAAAARTDCVVLARAPFGKTVAAVVEQARSRGVPVVFSADDLVFSPGDCDAPALSDPREDVVRGFRWTLDAYARSLAASDAFLGSTEVLVDAAREHGVPGLLVRNGIGRAMLDRLDRARRARIAAEDALPAPSCGVRIGFLTGTDTHDRDLESIAAPLVRALGRVPDATLVVVGPARLPAALEAMGDRVERVPFVPWS